MTTAGPPLLPGINSPDDLKRLSMKDLTRLAREVRELITRVVTRTGGHLASNLGVVELIIALHRVYDFSVDRLIFDVGHQCYAHKILTGRREAFETLRTYKGLSGYPKREESVYDTFDTGHAGTAISMALGLECGDRLNGINRHAVALVGDGAIASGMAFEALNHGGTLKSDVLVVLNDNEMSISRSVGALSDYFNRLRQGKLFGEARKEVHVVLKDIPVIGEKMQKALLHLQQIIARGLVPGYFFEELGFQYFGPVNGHKIKSLIRTIENIKDREGPKLLHVLTQKGRGHKQAVRQPTRYHSRSATRIKTEDDELMKEYVGQGERSYTEVFSEALCKLAREDERIVAITAAMPDGTGLSKFAGEFPDRYHDVGLCEQHAVGLASGMSAAGIKPVVAVYSTFLQRAYDQVFHDLCLQKADAVLALDRAGVVGGDGMTHNGLYDIAYLRHLPGTTLMAPADAGELERMLALAVDCTGLFAIRYPRTRCPREDINHTKPDVEIGRGEILRDGRDGAIIAYGAMVCPALDAARLLDEEGVHTTVVNARFAKPLDELLLLQVVEGHPFAVTVEDHAIAGGFGSAVLEMLSANGVDSSHVVCLGVPDMFVEHGGREILLRELGLSASGISERIMRRFSGRGAESRVEGKR
ncbi:MAG: 1-deoxy-D-xylulose-5-phosphate synthase [Planctomycetota bacterium]|nr:MAG: 1-deoxy-D-xylulose-5-phosphate synthase [Planctomycetota bacterium]